MKKLVVTAAASLICVAAFAQGKVMFVNDSVHMVYYDTTAAANLQGTGVNSANMPSGVTLIADLFAGTSSTSLTWQKSTTFGATPGRFNSANSVQLSSSPAVPGGQTDWFQVGIRDQTEAAALNEATASADGKYYGYSIIFSMTPGSGLSYNSIVNAGSPSLSTWSAGTWDASAFGGAGAKGAIAVGLVPEPSSFALCGLGAAAMLIFRRRK